MTQIQKIQKAKTQYCWKGSAGCGVPAQVVGEELARLGIKTGQEHRTSAVLNAARHPDSPLHGCFIWDDEKAAELQRLTMARVILRSIAVVFVHGEVKESTWCYAHVHDENGPRYVAAAKVMADADLKQNARREILGLLHGLRRRLGSLDISNKARQALDDLEEEMK